MKNGFQFVLVVDGVPLTSWEMIAPTTLTSRGENTPPTSENY